MINISTILSLFGASMALVIGVMLYGAIDESITCPEEPMLKEQCDKMKSIAWTVISILPIAMFFMMFVILGGFSGNDDVPEEFTKQKSQKTESVLKTLLVHLGLATYVNKGI